MSQSEKHTFDVFLSFPASESKHAADVAKQLREQGLDAFNVHDVASDRSVEDAVWEALAESMAVIAFIPTDGPTANMTFEMGAARAWHKPIYAVASDLSISRPSSMFSSLRIFPITRIDDIVRSIKASRVLTEEDRVELGSAYVSTRIPVDQLFTDPAGLETLVQDFRTRTGKSVAGELLLSELLRMRKHGRLKPLRTGRSGPRNAAGKV